MLAGFCYCRALLLMLPLDRLAGIAYSLVQFQSRQRRGLSPTLGAPKNYGCAGVHPNQRL